MTSNTAAVLQSGNLFIYTINNPVRFVDPTGLFIGPTDDPPTVTQRPRPTPAAPSIPPGFIGPIDHPAAGTGSASNISLPRAGGSTSAGSGASSSSGTVYECLGHLSSALPPELRPGFIGPVDFIAGSSGPIDLTRLNFASKQEAVHVWASAHHPHSHNTEWAAWIMQDSTTGRYSFSLSSSGGYTNGGFRVYFPSWPEPDTRVAGIHTHPIVPGSPWSLEFFTYDDANFAHTTGLPLFLVTPSGRVDRLYPGFPLNGFSGLNIIGSAHEDAWMIQDPPFIDNIHRRR